MAPSNRRRQVGSTFGQRPMNKGPGPFRSALGAIRPGIRYVGKMGALQGRRAFSQARNFLQERRIRTQISEEEIERAQQEAKWRRRQKNVLQLLKENRKEINDIIRLLVKNIRLTEKVNTYNFRNLNKIKNRRILESLAITFFEKYGTAGNLRNSQVIQKMLVDFDQQISRRTINIADRSPMNNLLIETQKEQLLDNAIREAQEMQ